MLYYEILEFSKKALRKAYITWKMMVLFEEYFSWSFEEYFSWRYFRKNRCI